MKTTEFSEFPDKMVTRSADLTVDSGHEPRTQLPVSTETCEIMGPLLGGYLCKLLSKELKSEFSI